MTVGRELAPTYLTHKCDTLPMKMTDLRFYLKHSATLILHRREMT